MWFAFLTWGGFYLSSLYAACIVGCTPLEAQPTTWSVKWRSLMKICELLKNWSTKLFFPPKCKKRDTGFSDFRGSYFVHFKISINSICFLRRVKFLYSLNLMLTRRMKNIRIILQIIFCHPPGLRTSGSLNVVPIKWVIIV